MAGRNDDEELKLVGQWASLFVTRVKLALGLKCLSYSYVEEDLRNKSELLLRSNPVHRAVPVLIHNGKPICESQIILQYIDEAFPGTAGPPLLPADPYDRAVARFWVAYVDDKLGAPWDRVFRAKTDEERAEAMRQTFAAAEALEQALKECSRGNNFFFGGDSVGYVDVVVVSGAWSRGRRRPACSPVRRALRRHQDAARSPGRVDGAVRRTRRGQGCQKEIDEVSIHRLPVNAATAVTTTAGPIEFTVQIQEEIRVLPVPPKPEVQLRVHITSGSKGARPRPVLLRLRGEGHCPHRHLRPRRPPRPCLRHLHRRQARSTTISSPGDLRARPRPHLHRLHLRRLHRCQAEGATPSSTRHNRFRYARRRGRPRGVRLRRGARGEGAQGRPLPQRPVVRAPGPASDLPAARRRELTATHHAALGAKGICHIDASVESAPSSLLPVQVAMDVGANVLAVPSSTPMAPARCSTKCLQVEFDAAADVVATNSKSKAYVNFSVHIPEHVPAAPISLALGILPSDMNTGAPAACLPKNLSYISIVKTSAGILVYGLSTFPSRLPDVLTLSLSSSRLMHQLYANHAGQVFDKTPRSDVTFSGYNFSSSATVNVSAAALISPTTTKAFEGWCIPDTYPCTVHNCIRLGNVFGAVGMFRHMKASGSKPNILTLACFLLVCTTQTDLLIGVQHHSTAMNCEKKLEIAHVQWDPGIVAAYCAICSHAAYFRTYGLLASSGSHLSCSC